MATRNPRPSEAPTTGLWARKQHYITLDLESNPPRDELQPINNRSIVRLSCRRCPLRVERKLLENENENSDAKLNAVDDEVSSQERKDLGV